MNEFRLSNKDLLVDESVLSTSNGYIGIRANFEEGYPENFQSIRGAYINGFYDDVNLYYGENCHGFPQTAQKMLNVIDAQTIQLVIDGEPFSLFEGEILSLKRELKIDHGYALREIEWCSPKGHRLNVSIRRMTSFLQLELFMIDYHVTSVNYTGDIKLVSMLEGDVYNYSSANDPRISNVSKKHLKLKALEYDRGVMSAVAVAEQSKCKMAVSVTHTIPMHIKKSHSQMRAEKTISIKKGETFSFSQLSVYTDSMRHGNCMEQGKVILKNALDKGADYWFDKQKEYLDDFWYYAQIDIEGDEKTQTALNFNVYQLLASAGKDGLSNIAAKGLSGEGYEGHYFWDTEIYMLPLFTLTCPHIAKKLMQFRYETLDAARHEARMLGHETGAKIPWRTISGSECSPYYPAGSAQYHINADVAYSIIQYYLFTQDLEYIKDYGFEVLFETARLWLDVGHYNQVGTFCIDAVTGPDEYTAIVNNNYYTNAMAQYHLKWVVKLNNRLKETYSKDYEKLRIKLKICESEIEKMEMASEKMLLLYDKKTGINPQDDSFLSKAEWDIENTPKQNFPLLLHYHPLTLYRHKVLKQADTLLAHVLLDDESIDTIKASYDYYEPRTTHDSSLSPCVHSIAASRINEIEKAYKYFMQTIRLDLDDLNGNTKDGLHIANAGGAYLAIVYGFGGLRIKEDGLHLRPSKPKSWKSITFRLNIQTICLTINIGEKLTLIADKPISLYVGETQYTVNGQLILPMQQA